MLKTKVNHLAYIA